MRDQPVITLADRFGDRLQLRHQRRTIGQPVEPCDTVQRGGIERQAVGLLVRDHLQAVLERAQPVIALPQYLGIFGGDQPGRGQRVEARAGSAQPQGRVASAVDQLVGLREEFDLADAPAPLLEIEAGAGPQRPVVVGADPLGQPADLGNRAEIEALAPDERPDRGQERLARRQIARAGARANERRALPRQRRAFVMAQRRFERDRQRADLAGGPQPQIDPEDIAFGIDVAHHFHQPPRHPLRRFARLVALAPRKQVGIVEQDRIDVGRIVQLLRAVFAQRQRDEPGGLGIGHAVRDRFGDRRIQRAVGKGG